MILILIKAINLGDIKISIRKLSQTHNCKICTAQSQGLCLLLKGSDFLLTESLTSKRMGFIQMLKKLRKKKKVNSYWTLDGNIYLTTNEDKILNLRSIDDFKYM